MNERVFTAKERELIQRVLTNGTKSLSVPERKALSVLRYRMQRLIPNLKDELSTGETLLEFLEYRDLFSVIAKNWRHFRKSENIENLLLSWFKLRETFRKLPQSQKRRLLKQLTRKNNSLSIEPSKGSDNSEARRTA